MCLQQAAQFTVSAAFASRVAVPSLAFTLCLPSQFQEAIHTVKAVMLFSNCCASALGELLRDCASDFRARGWSRCHKDGDWVPLKVLFDLSALGQVLSLMCAACLPVPRASVATPTASAISNTLEEHLLPRSPTAARCSPKSACEVFKALVQDVWLSLWLRRVMWWTAWALAMNPIHGLTLTYWQSMVRSKHILKDHNGYLSACMYLAASVLTLGAGGAWALQGSTSPLVLSSVFLAAYLLLGLSGADTRQLTVYGWIMLYQCLFEVTTAVATFQVGAEVTRATAASHSKARAVVVGGSEVRLLPRRARLTLLFSATTVLVAAVETGILAVINSWKSMESRFHCLGLCLSAVGLILLSFAIVEAWSHRGARGGLSVDGGKMQFTRSWS
eukprot:g31909.t1